MKKKYTHLYFKGKSYERCFQWFKDTNLRKTVFEQIFVNDRLIQCFILMSKI